MGNPPAFYLPPGAHRRPSTRGLNSDGTIDIVCRLCSAKICRQTYRNFSTAVCVRCQQLIEKGVSETDILAIRKAEEEKKQLENLYNQTMGEQVAFKANGIGKTIKDAVDKVKQRVTRRKKPLFSDPDKKEGG